MFPDADRGADAGAAMSGVWGNTGQMCTSGTRVMVHESVYDEGHQSIVDGSREMRIGDGTTRSADRPADLHRAARAGAAYIEERQGGGATLVLGGERHGDGGYFHQPTVLHRGARTHTRIAQEEIFGPVMSVHEVRRRGGGRPDRERRQVRPGGLGRTSDLARAHRASRTLGAGTVPGLNTYQMVYPSVPYGGVGQSGHGRMLRRGVTLDDFTQAKSVWMKVR